MAALSASSVLTWILYSIGSLGQVGGQSLVSQAVGAGDRVLARRAVMAALLLHLVVGFVVLTPLYLLDRHVFAGMGLAPSVAAGASDFLRPFLGGMVFYYLGMVGVSAFHAHGDAKTPAIVLAAALALNCLLDPFLIFGIGPVPAWGLFGAGLATAISKIAFTGVILWLLWRRGMLDLHLRTRARVMARLMGRVFSIGFPIAANGAIFAGVYLILIKILSPFGTVPVATLGIVHRIEGVAWFACVGFGVAAAALGGQLLGAGRARDALKSVWQVNGYLSAILLAVSAVYLVAGGAIVSVFISEPEVIAEGARYLTAIAVFEALMGWEIIFQEALGAVGDSKMAFLVATPLTLLRIPLAWLFAIRLGMGVSAVWWAISATTAAKGLGMAAAFSWGHWRRRGSVLADLA
jgi:putative MATE family efflux protein